MRYATHTTTVLATLAVAAASGGTEPDSSATAANPLGGGGGQVLEPVPQPDRAAPARRVTRQVYVCRTGEVATFTDRPCDAEPGSRLVVIALPGPGQPATTAPRIATASTRPRAAAVPAERPAPAEDARCARLRERLDRIDSQMRAGYSAREAASLWNRWRDARAQLRARRC